MSNNDAETFDPFNDIPPWVPEEPPSRSTPRQRPRWVPTTTMRPHQPQPVPGPTGHDAADRLPTDPGLSMSTILALSIGGVLGALLVLMLVYMFVLRKKYNSAKTQKNAAEYQVRIEDAVHVINNIDETCNTYVNTTDLQKLVNTVRAKGKTQERLPIPASLQKPALSSSPSSYNINNGFVPEENVTLRSPKSTPLVPPYETVVLNPEYNSKRKDSESNVDDNDSKEPKFLIPFKTMSIQEAQLVATTESFRSSQSSSLTSTISPTGRTKIELSKNPSTFSRIGSTISRPAPPLPPNANTTPKPSAPNNSKPSKPTPSTNQRPFTRAPSTHSRPAVPPPKPPSNSKPSVIIPNSNSKPKVPSNPKPSPLLPPNHIKPTAVVPPTANVTVNVTSLNTSPQNKLLSSVNKGKLPLLPPLKTGITPSLSRDASIDTPETAIEYLTPECAESSTATSSLSSKIAFLEGKLNTVNR